MVKTFKIVTILALITVLTVGFVYAAKPRYMVTSDGTIENYSYINQLLFESSRYTQTDLVDQDVLDAYHNEYQVTYPTEKLDTLGYELMLESSDIRVYFEKDSFSMVVYNKITGYYWSSRPELQGISEQREDNTATRNLMNSGLIVEYINITNAVASSQIKLESLYSLADVEYQNNGSITEENNDLLRPFYIVEDSYDYEAVETTITNHSSDTFNVHIELYVLDISFDVSMSIDGERVNAHIDPTSINETGEKFRLMSIQVFPYLGAAREDKIPGYIVIPDGVGAMIRMNQRYNTRLQARFYGTDFGYQSATTSNLTLPVYGMIHEVNQNGFYAHITEGAETASLILNLWGDSTRYQRVNAKYNIRQIFRYIINRAGEGNDAVSEDHTKINYNIEFTFLSEEDASYVGMAKDYRDQLIDDGILSQREQVNNNQIPIQLSYIMNAQEQAFIGTTRIEMTSPEEALDAYNYFQNQGLSNQLVTLLGWSKRDDLISQAPYRTRLANRNAYEDLFTTITEDGNTVYLTNDYIYSSEYATRINYNRDVAMTLSKLKMAFSSRNLNGQITNYYMLYPKQSLALSEDDLQFFEDLGVTGLHLYTIGNILFSYYDDENFERDESLSYYKQLVDQYDKVVLSQPNEYFYGSISGYLDMPITNTQYDFYTDLIPFIPIVLKGSVSAFTPYLNFNALEEDRLLMMVDFGLNPSYVLTEKETYEMRYTNAALYYTTQLLNYEDEIVSSYQYVNAALNQVVHAKVEDREVLATGFVKVTYDNDVIIYVNYTYSTMTDGDITVQPRNYEVVV